MCLNVSGMQVWGRQSLCAQLQSCTSGWRSFTPGGLLSEWLFCMKPAPSLAIRWIALNVFWTLIFIVHNDVSPGGHYRAVYVELFSNLLPHLYSTQWYERWHRDDHLTFLVLILIKVYVCVWFFSAAGKAHSRNSSMPRYPDHLILSCQEYAGHLPAVRLALHNTWWGP